VDHLGELPDVGRVDQRAHDRLHLARLAGRVEARRVEQPHAVAAEVAEDQLQRADEVAREPALALDQHRAKRTSLAALDLVEHRL
jgi:hypothetical protein